MSNYKNTETTLIHGGISIDERTGAVNIPIYQTSTYKQDGLGKMRGYEYSRTGNPTREALESLINDLEGGYAGFAFGSGMAALTAVLSLLNSGDRVLISSNVYGGTFRLLDKVFNHFNISYTIADTTDLAVYESQITSDVKAVIIESPANPLMTVTDIKAVAEVSHKHGLLVIVDNTFMTPYLQKPLALGADIVVHSATKYLGGHSDVVSGLAVVSTKELAEKIAFIQNSTGGVLGPFDSFLLIRGIKTLAVRMDRHVSNAEKVADFLTAHKAVKNVYYPGLESSKYHELAKKYLPLGTSGVISFSIKGGRDTAVKFMDSLELASNEVHVADIRTCVLHPASATHRQLTDEQLVAAGIDGGLVRLSVGLENVDDIIADIEKGFAAIR